MARKVNWAYEATADLEALAEYIARDSAFYASAFVIPLESPGIGAEIAGTAVGMILTVGCVGGFIFPLLNGLISGPSPGVSAIIYIALLCYVIGFGGAGILVWLLKETGPRLRDDA